MTKKRAPRRAEKPAPPSPWKLPEPTERDVRPAELAILATLINLGDQMGSESRCLDEAYRRIYEADQFLSCVITDPESCEKAIARYFPDSPRPKNAEDLVTSDEIIMRIREKTTFAPKGGKPKQIAKIKEFLDSKLPAEGAVRPTEGDIANGLAYRHVRMIEAEFPLWWKSNYEKARKRNVKAGAKKAAKEKEKYMETLAQAPPTRK
jgi:hypothetical protein